MALITFDHDVHVVVPFMTDDAASERGLAGLAFADAGEEKAAPRMAPGRSRTHR